MALRNARYKYGLTMRRGWTVVDMIHAENMKSVQSVRAHHRKRGHSVIGRGDCFLLTLRFRDLKTEGLPKDSGHFCTSNSARSGHPRQENATAVRHRGVGLHDEDDMDMDFDDVHEQNETRQVTMPGWIAPPQGRT